MPYLVTALVIAAGSVALVLNTVTGDDTASSAPSATGRAAPALSATGRLAYWRQNPAGAFVLSAANFDGSGARPLLTLPPNASRPFGTRWTGDGKAVSYVSDLGITVVTLDGVRSEFDLPAATRDAGFRVVDQRWSPSGAKVAATVFRSTDGKSDVFLATRDRRDFTRPADLGTAFAADWLNEDEVLFESTSGAIGTVREDGRVRKLVDQTGASPLLENGRIFFLAGPITFTGDASGIFVNNPSVWSVGVDGTGARREDRLGVGGDLRLDGRWPDGRYLVHVFRDSTQWLAGTRLISLTSSTLLRRVVVSADRRSAIGFGGARLVRIDLARGLTPDESAFVVLLDGIVGADAWVPRGSGG